MASVSNPISAELERLRREQARHTASTGPPPEPPPDLIAQRGTGRRLLKRERDVVESKRPVLSLDDARAEIASQMQEFAMSETPYMLLIAAPPGVGKTTFGVRLAEQLAASGKRVLYCGPRHDFFQDILQMAQHPSWWYEWLPRQHRDAEGLLDQCYRAEQMDKWLARGYGAMTFCSNHRICGWSYVNNGCRFHAQKQVKAPIVFGQHKHLTHGHPLMSAFDVIIGDENPLDAFMHHWIIPGAHIVPADMDPSEPLTEIVHELAGIAGREVKAEGPDLLNLLGGAARVREACAMFTMPVDAVAEAPNLRSGEDVDEVPYFHLPQLVALLERESEAALAGREYPHRVALAHGKLHLLLRNVVNAEAPERILWLDATGNQPLYEAMFARPVAVVAPQVALHGQIFQVWPRANGKTSLVNREGELTTKVAQLEQQVAHIVETRGYRNPAIITFQAVKDRFVMKRGHFYAARGTNQFEDCDALFIAGTPQPGLDSLHTVARMLFFERMTAFERRWSELDRTYQWSASDGDARSYPVSGFWNDLDLTAVLWQQREAEIIQAAHRVRPVLRNVDVWLLTNLPIDELPPTNVLSIHQLFGAPEDVDPYRWPEVVKLAEKRMTCAGVVTTVDFVQTFGCSPTTAGKYVDRLISHCGWDAAKAATRRGPGKPPKAAARS